MKKLRLYLDTSVINFLFVTDAPDFRSVTVDFFEQYSDEYELFISDVVLLEIEKDPSLEHRNLLLEALRRYDVALLPDDNKEEIVALASRYIEEGAIPRRKEEDAQHVAYATLFEMDVLLSWNFKHLANVNREQKIVLVNMKAGYHYPLRLLAPLELIYE